MTLAQECRTENSCVRVTCEHTNTHKHTHTHKHTQTQTHTRTHTHTNKHQYTQTQKHTNTHTHVQTHTNTHTHAHTNTHKHAHTHKHTQTWVPLIVQYSEQTVSDTEVGKGKRKRLLETEKHNLETFASMKMREVRGTLVPLDAGWRKDGVPVPQFWDCVVDNTARGNSERQRSDSSIGKHAQLNIEQSIFLTQ